MVFAIRRLALAAFLAVVAVPTVSAHEILHTFTGGATDGSIPCCLMQANDGMFYGTTSQGGTSNLGTIFRMTSSGAVTILHNFAGGTSDGASPAAGLIQATDGNFYGTTSAGGTSDLGTVFKMSPAGTVVLLHSFAGLTTGEGSGPATSLLQASDGKLYGTTTANGVSASLGTIYRIDLAGAFSVVHAFTGGADSDKSAGPLIQATDGFLYGSADGATNSYIFKMSLAGALTVVASVRAATLLQGADGAFYGLKYETSGGVSVFRMTPAGVVSTLATTISPYGGSLIQGADGNLYGTAPSYWYFNSYCANSNIYAVTPGGTLRYIDSFTGGQQRYACVSPGGLIEASDGNLYGTTSGTADTGNPDAAIAFRLSLAVPAAPTGLVAVATSPHVTLSWTASSNAISYNVKRGTTTGAETVIATDVISNGYEDTTTVRGQWYYYVVSGVNLAGEGANSTELSVVGSVRADDYDGDGKADAAIFSAGQWSDLTSSSGFASGTSATLGAAGDVPVPGDYDGDRINDFAVFRPSTGTWLVRRSSDGQTVTIAIAGARSTDVPVPGDYDGDGRTDPALFRPSTGMWSIYRSATAYDRITVALGISTDIPVPADYDNDGSTDAAVYRPSDGTWHVRLSHPGYSTAALTFALGTPGDLPVPADYDGDGYADPAVYRPSSGQWLILRSSTYHRGDYAPFTITFGVAGATPVPADYDGDGKGDPALFVGGNWTVLTSGSNYTTTLAFALGSSTDTPLPNVTVAYAMSIAGTSPPTSPLANMTRAGDFDGDVIADLTIYRPATGVWWTLQSAANYTTYRALTWGVSTDMAVPGDYDGDGTTDIAVYRPSTGEWWILLSSTGQSLYSRWGAAGDVPVPGDYDGDGRTDIAVYRPSTGQWWVLKSSANFFGLAYQVYAWGAPGDVPVPGDYDGDGITDVAIYRPSTGDWWVLRSSGGFATYTTANWGLSTDVAVPGDYDGDGKTDFAIYRPSTGEWWILQSSSNNATYTTAYWGMSGDEPVPADFDGDGKTDAAVYRPSTGTWFAIRSKDSTTLMLNWGAVGDVPTLR